MSCPNCKTVTNHRAATFDEIIEYKDSVLAEKDAEIARLKAIRKVHVEAIGSMEAGLQQDEEEIRHHKYKRCLAMAKLCHWKMGVFIYKKEKSDFYFRWRKRWLELAEKFKEAK